MNGLRFISALALLPAVGVGAVWADDATMVVYIAPDGNDAWSGLAPSPSSTGADGPLATMEGARDFIRRLKAEGRFVKPVRVLFRGGAYRLTAPVTFLPEDSGRPDAPIVYAAYPGEKALFCGGRVVSGWKREGALWSADVSEMDGKFLSFWVNGKRCVPARIPDEGYFFAEGIVPGSEDPSKGSRRALRFRPGDIRHWGNLDEVRVVVTNSWETSLHYIADICDADSIVTFTGSAWSPFGTWTMPIAYHVENTLEGLNQPGEWCVTDGVMHYLPRPGEDMKRAEAVVPVAERLVVLQGDVSAGSFVEFVRFEGLRFAHTDYPVPPEGKSDPQAAFSVTAAIEAHGARYCTFQDCEVAHTTNHGIWLAEGCLYNRVQRSNLHDLGAGGIRIGVGSREEDPERSTSWNDIDNNWIHGGGRVFPAGCGVWIGASSYNTVSHNEIFDMYYTGVSVGWSWGYGPSAAHHNIIEFNHIHRIGQSRLSDMGGIYTLGISPGTILRNNVIHDIWAMTYGGWGIYLDEGSTDILVENNVVYRTKSGGFHQHYGKENRIRNNVFAFASDAQIIRTREEEHWSFFFEKNVVLCDNGRFWGGNYSNGRFSFQDNLYWNYARKAEELGQNVLDSRREKGQDLRSAYRDPHMVDPQKSDFRFAKNAPELPTGFRSIDVRSAGLCGAPAWVRGPKKAARQAGPYLRVDAEDLHFAYKHSDCEIVMSFDQEWLFRFDPDGVGEREEWHVRTPSLREWRPIRAGASWEEQLGVSYDGAAWYWTTFPVRSSLQGRRLALAFGAVDETAVVYINGQKAGAFGTLGLTWNMPFEIDITSFVKLGSKNTIAVRVEDSKGAGGIWKKVRLISPRT